MQHPPGQGMLDPRQDVPDQNALVRKNQQVHVLGHDHEGPQVERMFPPGLLHGLKKPNRGLVAAEERLAGEAREGQVVSVPRGCPNSCGASGPRETWPEDRPSYSFGQEVPGGRLIVAANTAATAPGVNTRLLSWQSG
jgi:hypothetical protein